MLFLFLISSLGISQPKCSFIQYSTDDGLSDNRIMCITKDSEGFMWFGTWAGLNRFDGHNFVSFRSRPGDKSNLKNNRIEKIVDDKKGFLWLKSSDGQVYRFDKKTESFMALQDVIKDLMPGKMLVNHLIEGSEGEVWLMTPDHGMFLLRSNGSASPAYQQFCTASKTGASIPSNNILFFHRDHKNRQWLGTSKGMVLLAAQPDGQYNSMPLPPVPVEGTLNHIREAGQNLWFTGGQGQLLAYSNATNQFTAYKPGNTEFRDLYVAPNQQNIYLISPGNVLTTFNVTSTIATTYTMPGVVKFHAITGDKAGNIWIEPEQNGIVRFDTASKTFNHYVLKSSADFFNSFKGFETFEDKSGRFWAMMKGSGLGYYDPATKSMKYFYNDPANPMRLFPNSVRVLYYDSGGVMWFATVEEGLHRVIFHENNFDQKLLETSSERAFNEVRGLCTDHRDRLWMSTKAGILHVIKNDVKINVQLQNTPPGGIGQVYCITEDRQNNIWLGTKNNGLYKATPLDVDGMRYSLEQFVTGSGDSSISSNRIYCILQDNQGKIWVGTHENGLNLVLERRDKTVFLHRKNAWPSYPKPEFGRLRHLALDASGNLWIATTDGLLVMTTDNEKMGNYLFKKYSKITGNDSSLSDNDVQFIYKDGKNTMWLGTAGGGLNKAIGTNPGKSLSFKTYSEKNGLQSDYIVSCIADNNDHLWLTTPGGLSRFDGNGFRNFNSYDGLSTKGFSEAASTKLLNGDLVFGTINGYLVFSPQLVKDHKVNAALAFTHLQVNNIDIATGDSTGILNESINSIKSITLAHDQNILSIDYSILDYRFQDNGVFAYRLLGFDDSWHTNKNMHRTSYTNLLPGKYVFEVKNLSSDRYTNVPAKQLAIHILPPPWKTWWAYLIYAILAGVLFLIIYRTVYTMLRLRQRIAVEKRLTDLKLRFYTNISHELRTPLSLIQGPVDAIATTETLSGTGRSHISVVRKNAARMSRFINQLLDLGKVQSGKAMLYICQVEMAVLARQVTEYFSEALRAKKMHVNITAKNLYAWVDAEKMETVLYNLLANALKFSPDGSIITINVKQGKMADDLVIEVCDEGPGVAADELEDIFELYYEGSSTQRQFLKGTGIGLSLSKELIDLHHGKLYAKNNPDKGLTVVIELKTGKDHFAPGEATISLKEYTSPDDHEPVQQATPPPVPVVDSTAERQLVLLVEDNVELSDFVSQQLQALYRVEVASNGRQGLDKALALLPDLVVSDIMMPVMDGINMLDHLKKDPVTSHIPVVLLTAKYDVESQLEGLQYGADYYITKPFNTDILKAAINNLLEQRRKLFYYLQDQTKETPKLSPPLITTHDENFLKEVISFVETGMQETDFEIDAIATSVAMSRSAFYKKFKSLTNMAPVEFLNEMRLKKAKQLFDQGETNISDVSFAVGFNSPKYFSTSFRKYYQCSPSEYLKKIMAA